LDKASIFGLVAGVALVITAIILGSPLSTFFNIQGLLIVAGGTVAGTSIAFPTDELKLLFPVSRRVFRDPGDEMVAICQYLMKAMTTLKKDGPVALENIAADAPTKPVEKGIMLIADNTPIGTMKEILATERKYMEEHHRIGQKMFTEMGKYAPAFGMVGTLIGLVQMLSDMSDPENIGPAMAVALLTTFYGAVLANLIFLPMVTKLERRIQIEVTNIQLAIVGLDCMTRDEPVQILREKMGAFMNQQEGKAEAALSPS
jgi:chemotaxis protein MotA